MTAISPPAASIARGTVTAELVQRCEDIFGKQGFMSNYCIERTQQLELLKLSLLAGVDPLFLGDPGVGKTWMIELLLMLLDGAGRDDFFNTMVFKETPADDLLGPRDVMAMKAGRIERIMDGFLPTAVVAYLDEIFKASPTLVNALLDIMAGRRLKVGSTTHDVSQLLCIFGSSNELPDREDMLPFRDRWGITNLVPPVRTKEGRMAVLKIQDEVQAGGGRIDLTDAPRLSLDDVAKIRTEVQRIIVPVQVQETLAECQERWEAKGFTPSQRRMGQIEMAVKARAWSRGDGQAHTDDVIVAEHMAWNNPDHAANAREVVLEFANQFARKGARMREALEPLLGTLDELRVKIDATSMDDQLPDVFDLMKKLRTLKKDAAKEIKAGGDAGHDTAEIEAVVSELSRAHDWLQAKVEDEEA